MSAEVVSFAAEHAKRAIRHSVNITASMLSEVDLSVLWGLADGPMTPHEIEGIDISEDLERLRKLGCALSRVTETVIGDHVDYQITPFGRNVLEVVRGLSVA